VDGIRLGRDRHIRDAAALRVRLRPAIRRRAVAGKNDGTSVSYVAFTQRVQGQVAGRDVEAGTIRGERRLCIDGGGVGERLGGAGANGADQSGDAQSRREETALIGHMCRKLGHFYHGFPSPVNASLPGRLRLKKAQRGTPGRTYRGGSTVKRALAAIVGVAFVFASAGLVVAQTPATKADDKKMEDKKDSSMKKAPHH